MPAVVAAGIVGKALFITANIIATVALNVGLSKLSQALAGKRKGRFVGAPRDVTVEGTIQPMQMIYGEVVSPGFVANYATSGANNRYLHYVVVYAAHQCEDIIDLWLDGQMVPDADIDGSGNVSTAAFQGEGASRLRVIRHLGTKNQAADSELSGAAIGHWTANHRGAGVAYVHFRLDGSDEAFPNSPRNFRALVRGRRLYDPRKDSTNGGSGSHRRDNATTWEWSRNPALARRDYITGGSRWYDDATPEKRLGFGEPDSRIDDSFTITAANIDDELVTIPDGSGGSTTQPRYTCDVQLSCGETYRENLRILESASVGTTTYVNGRYRIYSGSYDTPEVELTEDDVLGPVVIATHPNGEDLYNFITGTFYDEARDWQLLPFPNITNSSYETADGGQFPRQIELHATRTTYRAQRIGILHLAQSRNKTTVRFERLSPNAMAIAQHETFLVTISEFGWNQKVFRCRDWEFMPDGFIAITAQEESASAYADPTLETYLSGEDGTVDTPQYDLPDTPINFGARAMPEGILFTWDIPIPQRKDQLFRLYEHTAQTPFSSAAEVWSGKTRSVMLERTGYTIRYYWLTAELNGIESSATPAGNGLAASPSIQGFEEEFFDSFEHQDYARFYDLIDGTPTITYPTNGNDGGRVLRAESKAQLVWKKNIVYDPAASYRVTVEARMVTAPSDSTKDNFFAGVRGIAADGVTTINTSGGSSGGLEHYVAASNFDFGSISVGTWRTFVGYLSGTSASPSPAPAPNPSDPMEMYGSGGTVTKFVRPVLVLNVEGGNGIMEVDIFRIEKLVNRGGLVPDSASDPPVTSSPADGSIVYSSATQPTVELPGLNGSAVYTSAVNDAPTKVVVGCTAQARISNTTSGTAVGEARLEFRVLVNGSLVYTRYLALEGYSGGSQYGLLADSMTFNVPAGQQIQAQLIVYRNFLSSGTSPAQTIFWRAASLSLMPLIR